MYSRRFQIKFVHLCCRRRSLSLLRPPWNEHEARTFWWQRGRDPLVKQTLNRTDSVTSWEFLDPPRTSNSSLTKRKQHEPPHRAAKIIVGNNYLLQEAQHNSGWGKWNNHDKMNGLIIMTRIILTITQCSLPHRREPASRTLSRVTLRGRPSEQRKCCCGRVLWETLFPGLPASCLPPALRNPYLGQG